MNRAIINVDPENVKFKLSEDMYGIFYEEINHSGDGGLYAELVKNRNFMDSCIPEGTAYYNGKVKTACGHEESFDLSDELPGWSLRCRGGALGKIKPFISSPRNEKVKNQIKLTACNTSCGSVNLVNSGYFGMAIKNEEYKCTIIAKSDEIKSLNIIIASQDGRILAKQQLDGITSEYGKYTVMLSASQAENNCVMAVSPLQDGTIYFDYISLFPVNTYKNRENGMNRDIANMIADLKPSFMRFPGGCIVEGINRQNAFKFKDTLGLPEDRAGHWNLWGYRRTDGIGYHEYLQFCEDIGANAMYVFNCGMSCQGRSPEYFEQEYIDEFLQDAIDAIDYATASTDNVWGALRAKNGHEKPFNLKYLEIGNENWGDEYIERYNYFYKELKKRYPDMIFIINYYDFETHTKNPDGFDIVDEHYYVSPERFPAMAHHFDNYERNSSKVYVGEYAANLVVVIGNMSGAVSEASFMINMEKNGDVVTMASYAPLLCHMNDRKWPVNLICFKDDIVFGIPSYYVQKMFAENKPESIVESDIKLLSFCNEAKVDAVAGIACDSDVIVKISNFSYKPTTIDINIKGGYAPYEIYEVAADSGEEYNDIHKPCNVQIKKADICEDIVLKPYAVYAIRYKKS